MSETTFTERELKLAQRRAFVTGALKYSIMSQETAQAAARSLYPLPKIQKPRVLNIPGHGQWCFQAAPRSDALLMYRTYDKGEWHNSHPPITQEIAAQLSDLFANPMETVEDPDA